MRIGAQFLIAVRLLSTVRNLSAHLTLVGRGAHLNLFCRGKQVVFLETSKQFPLTWLQSHGETTIAGELKNATTIDAKLHAFRMVSDKQELRAAFREAAREALVGFFQGEVNECKLKQMPAFSLPGMLTLSEVFFDCARPFIKSISPDELLPTKEIPFRQSADFLEHSNSIKMGAQDGYLLSRLEQQQTVREIVSSIPGDETDTRRNLLVFWAFGLLDSPVLNQLLPKVDASKEVVRETPTPTPTTPPTPGPSAMPTTTLKGENVAELMGLVNQTYQSLAKRDFYTLLGVDGRASMDEIKTSYYKLARKFHPDRFYGVQDPVLKEKVDVIFSAVNVAYETLKNAKRRLEYDNAPKERKIIGETSLNSETKNTKLTKEAMNKVADEHYRKAQKAYEEGNYYQAVQFLRSATQIEPNVAKYWQQLGISLSRNPQWRKEAEDSFQRAMDLEPKNPENHLYLGFLYKNAGMKLRARKHFQTCRDMDPYNEIANRELALIDGVGGGEKESPDSAKKGLLGNIFKKK